MLKIPSRSAMMECRLWVAATSLSLVEFVVALHQERAFLQNGFNAGGAIAAFWLPNNADTLAIRRERVGPDLGFVGLYHRRSTRKYCNKNRSISLKQKRRGSVIRTRVKTYVSLNTHHHDLQFPSSLCTKFERRSNTEVFRRPTLTNPKLDARNVINAKSLFYPPPCFLIEDPPRVLLYAFDV